MRLVLRDSDHYTVFHYSVDGKLLERTREPMESARLITGKSGNFYDVFEQPGWQARGHKAPDQILVLDCPTTSHEAANT